MNDYLVTEDTVEGIVRWLDAENIFTKPYTESFDGAVKIVGLRVGERPGHVVAFWGDTLRRMKDGSFVVMRMMPVTPAPELTWHTVSPDEQRAADATSFELAQEQERATCRCKDRKEDDYELSVDCGSIEITHTPCGKQPWFMFDDWNEIVHMGPQKIVVSETTCTCYQRPHCDCGPDVRLKTPEGKW